MSGDPYTRKVRNEPQGLIELPYSRDKVLVLPWGRRPEPEDYVGLIYIVDVGVGGSLWRSNGFTLDPTGHITLFNLTSKFTDVTGNTSTNLQFKEMVFGGLMGTDRELVFEGLYSINNTAGTKTLTFKAGDFTLNNNIAATGAANLTSINILHKWGNVGADNVQKYFPILSSPLTPNSGAMGTSTVNTASDFYIGADIVLSVGTDTARLNRLTVTLR